MIWFSCSFVSVSRCLVISFGGFGFENFLVLLFCGFDVYGRLWFWVECVLLGFGGFGLFGLGRFSLVVGVLVGYGWFGCAWWVRVLFNLVIAVLFLVCFGFIVVWVF